MNYFVIINGILYVAAAGFSLYQGHVKWAVVWLCYGVSALVMCTMEGKT
jgi:hypothetical protein